MRGSPWMSLGGSPLDIHGRESARYIPDNLKDLVCKDRGCKFVEDGLDADATAFGDNHVSNGMK
jgi:hypothetical protein